MQKNLQASKQKLTSSKDTDSTDSPFNIGHVETPTIKINYREPINLSKEILFNKYFESFNFYFSKHINEILADIAIPHVILYKDYLYYDDEDEYLRRYYKHEEAVSRIPNLSKFYLSVEGEHNKPNLAVHDQNEIILKRNNKLHEVFVNRLKQFESIPKTHREHEKPITFRILPKDEENTGYCDDSSTSYAVKKTKPEKNMIVEDEKGQNDSYQKMTEMQDDMEQVSYESQEHDVYNPSPVSSSTSMRVKRKRGKGGNKGDNEASENKTEVLEVQLLEGSFSVIGKTEGRESRESLFESLGFEQNSELCLSNASEISLIEQILGVPLDSEAKGGLVRHVENLQQKKKKEAKAPEQKIPPKKKKNSGADSQSDKEREESKKSSSVNKNSLSKSNQTLEDKSQKTEPFENKRSIINQELMTKPTIVVTKKFAKTEILNTDISEKLKTEEDISTFRGQKSKIEKSSVNTEVTSSSSVPLVPLETPKKVDYWAISQAKNNTPAKVPKVNNNNKSDPDVQSTSAGKIRPQKLRRSAQNSTIKKQVPACLQSPEVKAQEKYYDQTRAINYPERIVKVSKEVFLKQSTNPNDKSKEESKKKSRQLTEEKVDSYYKEERKQMSSRIEKSPQINGVYSDHQVYLSTLNSQTKTNISRSRTEDKTSLLLKSRTEDMIPIQQGFQRSFTDLHQPQSSASQTHRTRIVSSLKVLTSFTDNQQKSARLESASREGGSLGQILSTTAYNFRTQNSVEHGKSLRTNLSEERSTGSALSHRVPKAVSLRSLHNPNKAKTMVPNSLSSKTNSHEAYDYSSVIARRTMGQTASNPSINGKGHLLATTPISPRKHMNLNLNLKKLNQEAQVSRQHDSGIDNSYGFWTSRSSKGNVNETSKKSVKESPKLRSERALYTDGKDYGNQPKYGSITEKTSVLNSRRLTKVSMYHEFKVRENEMLRSIKNLKPDYLMAMWPPTSADKVPSDKQETKKRLASSGKRLSGSRIVKGKKKVDGKL